MIKRSKDIKLNIWMDANVKTMLLDSEKDLIATIRDIARAAYKLGKKNETRELGWSTEDDDHRRAV